MKKSILKLILGTPIAIAPVIGVISCKTSWMKWDRNDNPENLNFLFKTEKSPEEMWVTRPIKTLKEAWDEETDTIDLERLNNQFEFIKLFFEITNAKSEKILQSYFNVKNWSLFKEYIDGMDFSRTIKIKYKNNVEEYDLGNIQNNLDIISQKMDEGTKELEDSMIAKIVANKIKTQKTDSIDEFPKELINKMQKKIMNNFSGIDINFIRNSIESLSIASPKNILNKKVDFLINECKKEFKTLESLKQELKKQYSNQKNIDALNSCLNNISAFAIEKKDVESSLLNFTKEISTIYDLAKDFLKIELINQFKLEQGEQAIYLGLLTNLPTGAFQEFEKFIKSLDKFVTKIFDYEKTFKPWSKQLNFLLDNEGKIKKLLLYKNSDQNQKNEKDSDFHIQKYKRERASLKAEFIKEIIAIK